MIQNLLPVSRSLLRTSRKYFTVTTQPVVPAATHERMLENYRKAELEAVKRLAEKEAEAEALRESLRGARADSVAFSRWTDLRGIVEMSAKNTVKDDPALGKLLKKNPGVQECLRAIYDQDTDSNSNKKSLRAHVRHMCQSANLLEATIADILRTKLYHTLSVSHHGASVAGRVINQGGAHGWSPNEAAALSAYLDFQKLDYEFVLDGKKVDPPPYRI